MVIQDKAIKPPFYDLVSGEPIAGWGKQLEPNGQKR